MKNAIPHFNKQFLAVAVLVAAIGVLLCDSVAAQNPDVKITVDGTPLVASQPVVRQGNEWMVPLLAIARALSVEMATTSDADTIKLRRANGAEYTFNAMTGEIRNRFLLIGRIAPGPAILRGLNDELLFPLSGIVALFGVSVEADNDRSTIAIQSNRDGSANGTGAGNGRSPAFDFSDLNYSYGLTTNGRQSGQNASFQGGALMGAVRLQGSMETTRSNGGGLLGLAQASLRAELRAGKVVLFGDQSTYSGLDALTSAVRGIGYESRFRGFSSYYYVGRGHGSTSAALGSSGLNQYDTTVGGFSLRRRTTGRELAFAGNSFAGSTRKGVTLGAAWSTTEKHNQFKVQAVAGSFSGISSKVPVGGAGYGFAVADTFAPTSTLSFTAQAERYSRNFLSARDDSRFTGQSNVLLGVAFHPLRSLSFSGGVVDRITADAAGRSREFNYGAQYSLGTAHPILLGYSRSVTRSAVSSVGKLDMSQYSLSLPGIHSYSFSTYYSEIHKGTTLVRNLASFATKKTSLGQIGIHDQIQPGQMHRYGLDWRMNLGPGDSHLQFGVDRMDSVSGHHSMAPKASLRLPLFRGHSLELTYTHEPSSHMLQVALGGPVIRHRAVDVSSGSGDSLLVRPSNLKGRVYFDVNNDGRYEESVDKPLADVTLWLDKTTKVTTDAQGRFQFDRVQPGSHRLKADLSGIPADLVLADKAERTVAVIPYQEGVQNFRVLKMGRIVGKVTYLDYSEDPDNPIEKPLTDARLIVSDNIDTYTEINGVFSAGDLVPGEYKLRIDPETIPEGYISEPEYIMVTVKPGETCETAHFLVTLAPRPVIERTLPTQEVGLH